jgi:tRNA(Ile2) C34 agmatinyltransferase TiaS
MEHPFINDLSDKTLEELQESITSLNNKLTFAFRTGNGPLIHQLQMAIESYRNQHRKKMDEIFSKQKLNNQINIEKQ